jgi:hypothetical protein
MPSEGPDVSQASETDAANGSERGQGEAGREGQRVAGEGEDCMQRTKTVLVSAIRFCSPQWACGWCFEDLGERTEIS